MEFDTVPRRRALSCARLAPNPHNRKPRLVDLRKTGEVTQLVDATEVVAWRALTYEALRIETPLTFKESVDLFRFGRAEVDANPDGIDFAGPLVEVMAATGLFSREAALDPTSQA